MKCCGDAVLLLETTDDLRLRIDEKKAHWLKG
jgi:hypothetical protein